MSSCANEITFGWVKATIRCANLGSGNIISACWKRVAVKRSRRRFGRFPLHRTPKLTTSKWNFCNFPRPAFSILSFQGKKQMRLEIGWGFFNSLFLVQICFQSSFLLNKNFARHQRNVPKADHKILLFILSIIFRVVLYFLDLQLVGLALPHNV